METEQASTTGGCSDGVDDPLVVQKLSLIYIENAKVAATFWEWRHKLMERFFLALAGLIAGEAWIYHEKALWHWLFFPMLFGSIYSVVLFLMDRVNKKILLGCYETGKSLEQRLGPDVGVYTKLANRHTKVTYSAILHILYICTAVLFLVASALLAMWAELWAPMVHP